MVYAPHGEPRSPPPLRVPDADPHIKRISSVLNFGLDPDLKGVVSREVAPSIEDHIGVLRVYGGRPPEGMLPLWPLFGRKFERRARAPAEGLRLERKFQRATPRQGLEEKAHRKEDPKPPPFFPPLTPPRKGEFGPPFSLRPLSASAGLPSPPLPSCRHTHRPRSR